MPFKIFNLKFLPSWLFGLYLVSRLCIALWALQDPETRMYNGDSALYEQIALSLLETGEYLAPGYGSADTDPMADMIRPPGYPLIIAAVYWVFGTGFWGKVGLLLVNLAGSVALWWGVGRMDTGASVMHPYNAPALVLLFDLGHLLFSKEILTEMIFAPLMVWMVVWIRGAWAGRINDAPVPMRPYGAGTLLGLATLLKPITFYLPWVMIPVLRYLGWKWSRIAGFVLIAAGLPFLWQARNYASHGTFAYTSIAAENLMTGHAAIVLSAAEGYTHAQAIDTVRARYTLLEREGDTFDTISSNKSAIAKEILAEYPITFVAQMAKGVAYTLFDPGREVWVRTFGASEADPGGLLQTMARDGIVSSAWKLVKAYPFLVLYVLFLCVVYMFAVRGFYRLWSEDRKLFVLLTVLIAYFLVLGGPLGYARFRVYVLPLVVR